MTTVAPPLSVASALPPRSPIIYPESDGKPMADNTQQFQWIVTIHSGLSALFADDPNVFVAGDLLWYPVEGSNKVRVAPDVLVVFGRPKGHRGSYLQWQEGGIAPQVVFEIISPGNTLTEMVKKFQFYERFGVEEYYTYDPNLNDLNGWLRAPDGLNALESMHGWVSPRLKIKFETQGEALSLYHPSGQRFETYVEVTARAEAERQRAEAEHQRAEAEHQRAEQLAEKLRALGVDPATG